MKKKNKQYINVPNLFTAINLFCGFLSIIMTLGGGYANAAWLIIMASFFDALDGRIARFTGVSSEFGLQMDSLADVVSAGVAPAVLVYEFHLRSLGNHLALGAMVAFLPLLFACFRLARFNVISHAEGHRADYMGMPAPMAASTIGSVVILYSHTEWQFLLRFLVVLVPLVSLAMASQLTYEGFPHFNIRERGKNRFKLLFMFASIICVIIVPEYTVFLVAMVYLSSGPFSFVKKLISNQRYQEKPPASGDTIQPSENM
ncbi:MAG: CDP-diacylglycerol--serine O-phosphatidyltransferase [Calditrichaeota bacterium]|nr:MAG: CDP-diacylglycerol--serine O-phosphatidyltransferase [Calditrichota bacterium]